MNPSEATFKQALRDWIVARSGKADLVAFDDETPIIEQRIISSLQVMDLVLFLEELTGRSVDVNQLKPGVFRSVRIIYENFGRAAGEGA